MFVYALPFNTHGELWLANTEEEWTARADTNATGASTAAKELKSLKEFTLDFARTPIEPGDDLFQRLLLISHHGRRSVEDGLAKLKTERERPLMIVMSFGM